MVTAVLIVLIVCDVYIVIRAVKRKQQAWAMLFTVLFIIQCARLISLYV